jgi:hypothetical protein
VIITIGIRWVASALLIPNAAVNPSISGIMISITITCGISLAAISIASRPFIAPIT